MHGQPPESGFMHWMQRCALDAEMATSPNDPVNSLGAEQRKLQTYLDAYAYPVLTLPNEIVSEIFLQTLNSVAASPSSRESPLFLGHICHRWRRQISISTPSLWSRINLMVYIATQDSRLSLLDIWLLRSRNCPISISIIVLSDAPKSMLRFMEAILPHSRRFKALELFIPYADLRSIQGEFPLLRTLVIGCSDLDVVGDSDANPITLFDSAPQLDDLVLYSNALTNFWFRWDQITRVELRCALVHTALANMLCATTNLEILHIQIVSSVGAATIAALPDIPPLRSIHTLAFMNPQPGWGTAVNSQMQLLDQLSLPGLRELHVSEPYFAPDPVRALTEWATRSNYSLRGLQRLCINDARRSKEYYRNGLPLVGAIILKRAGPDSDIATYEE
ncbi:hypothetical protein C8R43DRAFT_1118766 [Mycena crocata]|nr:hypothetical protein C8R43DRAFT_1118766 [Mycena crocata]